MYSLLFFIRLHSRLHSRLLAVLFYQRLAETLGLELIRESGRDISRSCIIGM